MCQKYKYRESDLRRVHNVSERCCCGSLAGFRGLARIAPSNYGRDVEVSTPNAFAGWMRPFNACGLEGASLKIRWGSADLVALITT